MPPPSGSSAGGGRGPRRPWWRSGKGLGVAAGVLVAAVVATVLVVTNHGGTKEAVPTANEVALQAPADPGPAPFTPSVETQAVSAPAPAPTSGAAQPGGATKSGSPAVLHSVQGTSAGLYGGTMSKPSCDTERLIGMVSSGDAGRAWASAAGIDQSAIPSYLRSLTSAYLRVDTRITNHSYKSGAVVEYQSVLQAGTAVLVDAQGVPRVRCACGNPLKPAVLVSNAKYTGKVWTGFEPTTLIVVTPAPQPVTEIILVNIETGGWFSRLTGRIEVVDKHAEPPKGPMPPGIPPPVPWMPPKPTATASGPSSGSSSATTSGATSSGATSSGATSSGATSSGATSSGATTSGATSSGATSSGTPSGTSSTTGTSGPSSETGSATTKSPSESATTTSKSPTGTAEGTTSTTTGSTSSGAGTTGAGTTGTGTTGTGTTSATGTAPRTPVATCASTAPSTLPPCPSAATP
ncbi:DUF6777 domain-containing protein [Kitasatospora sp. NPDC058162]|uniref:DUF6777 domain-containing protein n=1 Tax=Kitasatospora sp. NPDC058162 TaxID=3346362 RepID=UPI0036D80271